MLYAVLIPALLPVILVFWFINRKDKIEKEPKQLIFKAMLWGAILSIPCAGIESILEIILKLFFEEGTITYIAMENVVGVALIEELSKYIVFMRFIWKNDNFDYKYDGIVYAVAASLGFAALENVLYLISFGTDISLGRALFAIPGHATFGIFMGYYLSRAKKKFCENKDFGTKRLKLKALIVPTIIHGIYDFLLDDYFQEDYFYIFFLFVIILDIVAICTIVHESKTDCPLGLVKEITDEDSNSIM